ncbi:MAG: enoyl-CoA hydratase/isomerase family protein [Nocardioides sp.]|uniref:enoyl-CoA hydratase/isomerase family protein n=1 Tax=Nocardioides sp. TaxID=35761 RepID=UPI0039E527B2
MTNSARADPSLDTDEVRAVVEGRLGRLTLDRPRAINALTPAMVGALRRQLLAWREDPAVDAVWLDGAGDRGLCAGGDIKRVRDLIVAGELGELRDFWAEEYLLDRLIARYPKPVVAIAHGMTMGGGLGLAGHASHCVVTESTRIAMPEVAIGLAPDVAGLWLLSRLPSEIGTLAALSGRRLDATESLATGLARHFVPGNRIERTRARLAAADRLDAVRIAELLAGPGPASPASPGPSGMLADADLVARTFAGADLRAILGRLRALTERDDVPTWAAEAYAAISAGSPTALAVTLAGLRRAETMSAPEECWIQDLRVCQHFARGHDLSEGIRAQVVDKDRNPRWRPARPDEVTRDAVLEYFAPIGPDLSFE